MPHIPLGQWVSDSIDWLLATVPWLFDGISAVMQVLVDGLTDVLVSPPPVVWIVVFTLLARALQEGRGHVGPRELVADFATIAPDRPLVEFVHLVGRHPVPLGVVDDDGRLLGVVPRAAVLDALAAVPARREG